MTKLLGLFAVFFIFSIPSVYGAEITVTNGLTSWYSYDCTDSNPSTWTQSNPNANSFKYFSFTDGSTCHAVLIDYDLTGLENIENVTSVNVSFDSASSLITDTSLSNQYTVGCDLFVFGNPTISGGVISQTPDNYGSYSCTGNSTSTTQLITIPFNATEYGALETQLQGGNMTYSIMNFPDFNATMRTNLSTNGYEYGVINYRNNVNIEGDGFFCMYIKNSGMCNVYYEPWEAVKDSLGEDYIGEWFYVLMFFPIPMSVFLSTRNGAYAGFTGLGIMLVIQTIDQTVFEIALSMVLISAGFGFYEVLRKRLTQ